jgi:hypothetical protein
LLGTVEDLPEPERQQLIAAGVRSVAALPVWGQGQWFGYLCVQDLQQQRRWSDSERAFLHTVADMIGAFLESRQHTRTLDRAIVQLRDSERALQHRARHDPLTGLGNRVVQKKLWAMRWHMPKRGKTCTAMCCCWTWTVSNPSTTPTAMRPAMCCCRPSHSGCRPACAARTP